MRAWYAALISLLTAFGCGEGSNSVASLVDFSGGVETQSTIDGSWQPAKVGAKLGKHSGLRTSARSTARLRFGDGSTLDVDERSLLRFSASQHKKAAYKLRMEIGTARFRSGAREHVLDVDDIVTKVGASSEFQIEKQKGKRTRLSLLVGEATVLSEAGALRLQVGKIIELPKEPSSPPLLLVFDASSAALAATEPADAAPLQAKDAGIAPTQPNAGTQPSTIRSPITATLKRGKALVRTEQNSWTALPKGASPIDAEAEVKVAKKTTLLIERGGKHVAVHGPAKFTVGSTEPSSDLIALSAGRAVVTTTTSNVRIAVPGGAFSIRASPGQGSRATITAGPESSSLRARSGLNLAFGSIGPPTRINIGEVAILGTTGDLLVENRAPNKYDVVLRYGESLAIHDPSPPTSLRFDVSEQCQGDAIIQVSQRQATGPNDRLAHGNRGAAIRLPSGNYWYRARCLEDGVASSFVGKPKRLQILKDAATRVLPSRVPQNTIEADGRSYELRYEGTLPSLTFRWPRQPNTTTSKLHLTSPGRSERVMAAPASEVTLKSGEVGEGRYEFFFRSADKQSRKTKLIIAFDPSAPSIELQSPTPSGNWASNVEIRGIAAQRWSVALRVRGTVAPIKRDTHGRFSAKRDTNDLGHAFSIQLSNPTSRPQLYLRRRN